MPLVSVVVPAWNRGRHIREALQSVIGQTVSDWEIIVVDDGSTDDTGAIVSGLAAQEPRISLVTHRSQRGAQAARNTGIRAARGRFVAFLDSDDQLLPDSLKTRLRLATDKSLSCVHSECLVHHRGEAAPRPFGVPALQGRIYDRLLAKPGPIFPGLLVTKKALERIGGLDETIVAWQEWDTAIRLAKDHEFGFISEPTFLYDCRHAGTISKNLEKGAIGYEQICRKHRWAILLRLGPRALAKHYVETARLYQAAKNSSRAVRCRITATLLWPFLLVSRRA